MKRILCILLLLLFVIGCSSNEKQDIIEEEKKEEVIKVEDFYNKYVITNKEADLYDENNNKVGKINKNIKLVLEDIKNFDNIEKFKIYDMNLYISYKDVDKTEMFNYNDRYKRYVVFNKNIVTKDKTTLYNNDGYVYSLDKSITAPIIVKEKDKYYIEYNNELLYVLKSDVSVTNKKNTKQETRSNIRTFTYHAVYKNGENCKNKAICHPYKQFKEQMKYLHDNNYLTLTMEELEMFLDKKINIPKKTVVITLDDGNLAKNALEILDKYEIYATYFIITGRYDSYTLESEYVSFESHSDNLHNNYKCPGGQQGGQLLCETESKVLKDLKKSQDKLNGSIAFSYPFFDWNDRAIKLLKKSGFRLAFIGEWDTGGYSDYNTNRMLLKRKTIFSTDSLDTFISYLD